MLDKFRALDCFAYLCTWSSCPGVIVICPLVFLTTSLLVEQNINVKSSLLILVSAFLLEKLLENNRNNIREGFFSNYVSPGKELLASEHLHFA